MQLTIVCTEFQWTYFFCYFVARRRLWWHNRKATVYIRCSALLVVLYYIAHYSCVEYPFLFRYFISSDVRRNFYWRGQPQPDSRSSYAWDSKRWAAEPLTVITDNQVMNDQWKIDSNQSNVSGYGYTPICLWGSLHFMTKMRNFHI